LNENWTRDKDGTVNTLSALSTKTLVEGDLAYHYGNTLAFHADGCSMDCRFCAIQRWKASCGSNLGEKHGKSSRSNGQPATEPVIER
jgi:biotin synthase-related radical SAM superfamily protein